MSLCASGEGRDEGDSFAGGDNKTIRLLRELHRGDWSREAQTCRQFTCAKIPPPNVRSHAKVMAPQSVQ